MDSKYYFKKLTKENSNEIFGYEYKDFIIKEDLDKKTLIELGLSYAIIYNYDGVITEHISNIELDYENIIEARFFNEYKEIRIFSDEGNITGTIFKEDVRCKSIENDYILYPRYGEKDKNKRYAKKLIVKEYIDYDDDNQAYVSYVKPSKLIFTGGVNR